MAQTTDKISDTPQLLDTAREAAGDVVKTVSETTEISEIENHSHEVFYKSAEFWVGFAFILVIVFLAKPVGKVLKAFLAKRRDNIISQIEQAEKLHDDAQKLLARYERKFINAKDEAQQILDKSRRAIADLQNEELNKLDTELAARRKEVEAGIAATVEKARKEMNVAAASKAVLTVKNYLTTALDAEKQSSLIDTSMENIFNRLK